MKPDHPVTADEALARLRDGNARFVAQYAGSHLKTPLFVVLGHEGCGAVKAALATKLEGAQQKSRIAKLLENIVPALTDLDFAQPEDVLLHAAVEANVRHTIRSLHDTPEVRARVVVGEMKLVGAEYELATGRVRYLDSDAP